MRLRFDQNLSHLLVYLLDDLYPGSTHVRLMALRDAPDPQVRAYAREHDLAIVTKDGDDANFARQLGHPPRIVLLRLGNCVTAVVEALLRRHHAALLDVAEHPEAAVFEIF